MAETFERRLAAILSADCRRLQPAYGSRRARDPYAFDAAAVRGRARCDIDGQSDLLRQADPHAVTAARATCYGPPPATKPRKGDGAMPQTVEQCLQRMEDIEAIKQLIVR